MPSMSVLIDTRPRRARAGAARKRAAPSPWLSAGGKIVVGTLHRAPVRPLAWDPRVLIGWPLPLCFGLMMMMDYSCEPPPC